jgi:hypothetical protein
MAGKEKSVTISTKGWKDIKVQAPPFNKEVECRNLSCGCSGRGYNVEKSPNVQMKQILREPNAAGNYSQDFKWQVAEWRLLIDGDD